VEIVGVEYVEDDCDINEDGEMDSTEDNGVDSANEVDGVMGGVDFGDDEAIDFLLVGTAKKKK